MFESKEFLSYKNSVCKALVLTQGERFQADLIDFNALFDSSLTVQENIDNTLRQLSVESVKSVKELKALEHKAINESNERLIDEVKAFRIPSNSRNGFLKQCLAAGVKGNLPFVVVVGSHGWAKTSTVLSFLNENKADYAYLSGYSTPLGLFNWFNDNKGKKVLVLDDLKFNNPLIIGMLKQACARIEGVPSMVQYTSTSKAVVESVIADFKPSVVLICNEIPRFEDSEVQSLIGRAVIAEVCYSFEDKKEILTTIASNIEQTSKYFAISLEKRLEIVGFLTSKLKTAKTEVSIRTLLQLFDFYLSNNSEWRLMAENLLQLNPIQELVLKLNETSLPVQKQFLEFHDKTGSSRATYQRIRRQLELWN